MHVLTSLVQNLHRNPSVRYSGGVTRRLHITQLPVDLPAVLEANCILMTLTVLHTEIVAYIEDVRLMIQ